MKTTTLCRLSNDTPICVGPDCPVFKICFPEERICPECLKDILIPQAEGNWKCDSCGAILY